MNRFEDMIHMERPASKRPKMDLGNRANLFMPFSALRGFDMAVLTKEKENALVPRALLSDDMQEVLERKLRQISVGDTVAVTYFSLQKRIGGYEVGQYITERGAAEEIDEWGRTLVLPQCCVPFADIFDLQSEVLGHTDAEQA